MREDKGKWLWCANLLLVLLCMTLCCTVTEGILNALLTTVLLDISLTDSRSYRIPRRFPVCILFLGMIKMILMRGSLAEAALGVLAAGIPLLFLYCMSRGQAIGGGDVKLMASAGIYLGSHRAFEALFIGCLAALIFHSLDMKFRCVQSKMALGPYLSFGIWLAAVVLS